jgi:hypothetical protein
LGPASSSIWINDQHGVSSQFLRAAELPRRTLATFAGTLWLDLPRLAPRLSDVWMHLTERLAYSCFLEGWHARKAGLDFTATKSVVCQNPFGISEGTITDEVAICDICNGD